MAKYEFSLTPKEFSMVYLIMKAQWSELIGEDYRDLGWSREDYKAFNRALEKMNMKAHEKVHVALQLEGNGEVYDYEG